MVSSLVSYAKGRKFESCPRYKYLFMDTLQRGSITELQVQLDFIKLGYDVFTPICDGCIVDLVFINNAGIPKKVQIKSANKTATGFKIEIRRSISATKRIKTYYDTSEIDYFATHFKGISYIIPIFDVFRMNTVTLRFNDKYSNQNKPFFASDYELK